MTGSEYMAGRPGDLGALKLWRVILTIMDRKKRNTLLLIAVLVVILGAASGILRMTKQNVIDESGTGTDGTDSGEPAYEGAIAVIQQEGQVLMEVPLNEDRDFIVQHPGGGFNAVQVKDGKICVTDADCPDLTCVRTGNAWEEGQVIACLPHRLIIYIDQVE